MYKKIRMRTNSLKLWLISWAFVWIFFILKKATNSVYLCYICNASYLISEYLQLPSIANGWMQNAVIYGCFKINNYLL